MVWASGHPPKLNIPALAFEVTSCKYQAYESRGTNNNKNDGLHDVISLLKSIRWHKHSALGSEEASCECQAHHSHGTKNNENDALLGVIFFLKSSRWHWNPPFVCASMLVIRIASLHSSLPFSRLIHSCMYGQQWRSSTPSFSQAFRNRTISTSTSVTPLRSNAVRD